MKLIIESTLFVLLLWCCCCCRCCITDSDTCWVDCPKSQILLSECFLKDDGTSETCDAKISNCENVSLLIDLTPIVQALYIYNSISNLEISTFRLHPDINLLRIEATYIHHDLFYLLPKLSYLYLYEVKFEFFPYLSDSNPLLTHLSIHSFSFSYPERSNSILGKGYVSSLSQLNYLYLYSSQLITTTDESFSGLTALTSLDLGRFHASNPVATFSPLVKLKYLDFYSSEFADVSFLSLTPSLFGLTYLSLAHNKITHVPSNEFLNYTNLIYLYLYHNEIATLEEDCFKGLSKLVDLYLNDNQLKDLSTTVFEGLDSLSWIDLSRNSICHLSSKTFESLKQPDILELHDVPLCCDCDLQWMSKADFDIYSTSCASPPQYVNRSATDSSNYVNCIQEFAREVILTL